MTTGLLFAWRHQIDTGLAFATGMVLDAAIVVLENIFRHHDVVPVVQDNVEELEDEPEADRPG